MGETMCKQKILTIQDLSCVGQCSLTVALPILSYYGFETCVLPTALLSNHTMFSSWSYLDLTKEIPNIFKEWERNHFTFDAFLLGYLGKIDLIEVAKESFEKFSNANTKIFIDPVFADNGKIYPGFNMDYILKMREILKYADFILPNVTEACFLTGMDYQDNHDFEWIKKIAHELRKYTSATIVITGIERTHTIGEFILEGNQSMELMHPLIPFKRHGTGDLFSAVFTANYLHTQDVKQASNHAAKFVADSLQVTSKEHFYGVEFEKIMSKSRKEGA